MDTRFKPALCIPSINNLSINLDKKIRKLCIKLYFFCNSKKTGRVGIYYFLMICSMLKPQKLILLKSRLTSAFSSSTLICFSLSMLSSSAMS